MAEEEVRTARVLKRFYSRLVKTLPMEDPIFVAELYSRNLLPGNLKGHVESLATPADKALYFLDHVIQPSVTSQVGSNFDSLLGAMVDSEYDRVKELGNLINGDMSSAVNTDQGFIMATIQSPASSMKSSSLDVSSHRLKVRYLQLLPTAKTDWPKHSVTQYVRLALVEKEDITLKGKSLNEFTKLTLQGDVDNILKKKKPLTNLMDIFHYESKPYPRVILITGGPGIGKTTLAHEICVNWANDGFVAKDFDFVLLVPLRSVQQRSLEEVMKECIGEEGYLQLKKLTGRRCLIILEGWDELAIEHRQNDPFLIRLIKECTVLEEAVIMVTSQPHACEDVDAGRSIEVVGFGNAEITEFVKRSFPKDDQSVYEFFQQLDQYPQLHSLCYVPMNLVMIVDIFHCREKKLPSTLTELYRLFTAMTLQREVKKNKNRKLPCSNVTVLQAVTSVFPGISKSLLRIVQCLSRLSYCGFFEQNERWWKDPKIIFTESDLSECEINASCEFHGFGLLKPTKVHHLLTDTNTYSFVHMTIQEFLCALHISTLSEKEQLSLLSKHYNHHPGIFIFLFGLTGTKYNELFQFMYHKLTLLGTGNCNKGNPDVITAARCISEINQCVPTSSLPPFTLNTSWNTLLPYDCLCVSHVLTCYPVLQLKMERCGINNKGAEVLVKRYTHKGITTQLLEKLDLSDNELTSEGLQHIMKIVRTSNTTLRVLDVSGNAINDEGMTVLSDGLQSNESLTKLRVAGCGLSVEGAKSIGKIIKTNRSLQELHMMRNRIGDDGISAIAEALSHSKISTLNVGSCDIALAGVTSLGKALSSNHSIRVLVLRDNPITTDGAVLIMKSALDSNTCQCVAIDAEYDNDEVSKVLMSLKNRKRQEKNKKCYKEGKGKQSEELPQGKQMITETTSTSRENCVLS